MLIFLEEIYFKIILIYVCAKVSMFWEHQYFNICTIHTKCTILSGGTVHIEGMNEIHTAKVQINR